MTSSLLVLLGIGLFINLRQNETGPLVEIHLGDGPLVVLKHFVQHWELRGRDVRQLLEKLSQCLASFFLFAFVIDFEYLFGEPAEAHVLLQHENRAFGFALISATSAHHLTRLRVAQFAPGNQDHDVRIFQKTNVQSSRILLVAHK